MGFIATSDPANKLIFSDDRTVADLLRGFVAAQWHRELDFDSLSKRSSEFIGEALARRIGDMAWTVEFITDRPLDDGGQPYLAVLLELQSSVEQHMALCLETYTTLGSGCLGSRNCAILCLTGSRLGNMIPSAAGAATGLWCWS